MFKKWFRIKTIVSSFSTQLLNTVFIYDFTNSQYLYLYNT